MKIIPEPLICETNNGEFRFSKKVYLHVNREIADNAFSSLYAELWSNFTYGKSRIQIIINDTMKNNAVLSIKENIKADGWETQYDYELRCDEQMVQIGFSSKEGLAYALSSTLQIIDSTDIAGSKFFIPCCNIKDIAQMKFRGIHLCVFPETELDFLHKTVRLCGFLKYSHIVLEFWGMLKFDCLDALSWKGLAYTKEQLMPIVAEGRAMGIEFIPMFNHLGHGTQSRVIAGKHVVLDQRPELAKLFEPDGWTWCISNPETLELLQDIRQELLALFGEGEYFHLGCDEAYLFASCDKCNSHDKDILFIDYMNSLAKSLKKEGRKPIMWGDMCLQAKSFPGNYYVSSCSNVNAEKLMENLDETLYINDWQYGIKEGRLETAEYFAKKRKGDTIILSPWTDKENIKTLCGEAKRLGLHGVLETTWHTLRENYGIIMTSAVHMWQTKVKDVEDNYNYYLCHTANLMRKIYPCEGDYVKAGFLKKEL